MDSPVIFNIKKLDKWISKDKKKYRSIYLHSVDILRNVQKYNQRMFLHLSFFLSYPFINRVLEKYKRTAWKIEKLEWPENTIIFSI
jgi:hypothetical protein